MVDTVNENFKNNMADMGCAGEVKLNESAGEAYEQWKLEIWVKFRAAEDMHVLTATRQTLNPLNPLNPLSPLNPLDPKPSTLNPKP